MPKFRLLAVAAFALLAASCGPKKPADVPEKPAAASSAEADAFLAKNAKEPGVTVLPSGLQYKIISSGPAAGPHPTLRDEIKVNYSGSLINGEVFDSTDQRGQPAVFPLDGLVAGWTEGLQLMRPGDVWMLYVPPKLGYGAEQKGPIPANSVLVFRLELLGVLQTGNKGLA
ncbi:MAG: FKBP-type peptidyl-prolyl cis-trans isomerase [Caulobacteraceae bacterium]